MIRIWAWLKKVGAWLFRPLRRHKSAPPLAPTDSPLRAILVDDQPDVLASGECYVVGEGEHRWFAAFACPCGCGEDVVLNLLPDMRPRWRIEIHDDETVSIQPSIHRHVGCRSHFFVRRGLLRWCHEGVQAAETPAP